MSGHWDRGFFEMKKVAIEQNTLLYELLKKMEDASEIKKLLDKVRAFESTITNISKGID